MADARSFDCRPADAETIIRLPTMVSTRRMVMAKGQMRSNREKKKPKADKKKIVAPGNTVPSALAKTKYGAGAATAGKK